MAIATATIALTALTAAVRAPVGNGPTIEVYNPRKGRLWNALRAGLGL